MVQDRRKHGCVMKKAQALCGLCNAGYFFDTQKKQCHEAGHFKIISSIKNKTLF